MDAIASALRERGSARTDESCEESKISHQAGARLMPCPLYPALHRIVSERRKSLTTKTHEMYCPLSAFPSTNTLPTCAPNQPQLLPSLASNETHQRNSPFPVPHDPRPLHLDRPFLLSKPPRELFPQVPPQCHPNLGINSPIIRLPKLVRRTYDRPSSAENDWSTVRSLEEVLEPL